MARIESRCRRVVLQIFFLLPILATSASYARVELNVSRIGFPAIPSGDVVRNGAWTPIHVALALVEQSSFDGTLRASQFDNDGDACFDSVQVHLRADTGGSQEYDLYVLANPRQGEMSFSLELLDDEGEIVEVISQGELTLRPTPSQTPTLIADDDVLILSVSSGTIGRVADLVDLEKRETFLRPVHLAHISPGDLPQRWIGLETVDFIVWDDAKPEELTSQQLKALAEWVKQGGILFIAASRTAGAITLTQSIHDILPADLGELVMVDDLPNVRESIVGPPYAKDEKEISSLDWLTNGFPSPVPTVISRARPGAVVVLREAIERSNSAMGEGSDISPIVSHIITRGQVGKGFVIFSGVTVKDLFSAEGEANAFFAGLFHFREMGEDEVRPQGISLFNEATGPISFARNASTYLILAGFSSVSYVLLSTLGAWGFLRAKKWQKHSWTTFAICAIAASAITIVVINSMRGFSDRLHQVTVVDLNAGTGRANASSFFGLKTAMDKELDLWLPTDPLSATEPEVSNCFLRPIASDSTPMAARTSFADPQEYQVIPASAELNNVRIRGTLKQFEGRWEGLIGGQLTGKISVRRDNITQDSFIVNNLGFDLRQCLLLQPTVNAMETGKQDEMKGTRDQRIYAWELGDLPSNGKATKIVPLFFHPEPGQAARDFKRSRLLNEAQKLWAQPFQNRLMDFGFSTTSDAPYVLGDEKQALMLLTTLGEFDSGATLGVQQWGNQRTFSRDRLRTLDFREHLTRQSVILIGFSDDPGPVRLFGRQGDDPYKVITPDADQSLTMYRIRIPVTILDQDKEEMDADDQELSQSDNPPAEGYAEP